MTTTTTSTTEARTDGSVERTLTAGVARIAITPPVGIFLTGFAGRAASTGVHDDLTAAALVLGERGADGDEPGSRVALLALDVLGIPGGSLLETIKRCITEATGIPAARIFLNCSHTHYGPVLANERNEQDEREGRVEAFEREGAHTPDAVAYRAALPHHLAGVVAMAEAARRPVTLAVGRGSVRAGINRRERTAEGRIILGQNPEGPLDSEVVVWRFDASGAVGTRGESSVGGPAFDAGAPAGWVGRAPAPVAVVVHYACHGVSLGGRMQEMSADFVGPMREVVERLVGGMALFVQGAAGDINPSMGMRPGADDDPWAAPRRLGIALGAEATRVALQAAPVEGLPLRVAREPVDLPPMMPESVEAGRARVAALEAEHARLEAQPPTAGNAGQRQWNATLRRRAQRALDALEGGAPLPPIVAEIGALRIGDAALSTNPSELFCEIGMSIKRASPFRWTAVAGYTDGSAGYVPTRAAYPEGGYEVERACRVAPEAGELLEETALRLLRSLE